MPTPSRERLFGDHQPAAVHDRLATPVRASTLPDAVLGGIDGCVTTFAVVSGAFGAGFSPKATMMREEYGLSSVGLSPLRAALATFSAFLAVGTLPLLPYALPGLEITTQFLASLGLAGGVFLGIGMLKSAVYGLPAWRSGLRTLFVGTTAAGLAFATGFLAQGLLGA